MEANKANKRKNQIKIRIQNPLYLMLFKTNKQTKHRMADLNLLQNYILNPSLFLSQEHFANCAN